MGTKDTVQCSKKKSATEYLAEEIERRERAYPVFMIVWLTMLIITVGLCFWGLILVDFMGYHAK